MPRILLTEKFVAGVKPKAVEQTFTDEHVRGLTLRVYPSGERTWMIRCTAASGKRLKLDLGTYPHVGLAAARGRGLETLAQIADRIDPSAAAAGEMTVAMQIESYLAKHVRPNLRSAKAVERRLNVNVVPLIGNVKLGALHRRDCTRVVDAVMTRGRATEACRVFQDVRALLRWSESRGDLDHSPMSGMRLPAEPAPRERVLDDAEIAHFWTVLPEVIERSPAAQRILKLCLLTAQRIGEVAGMERREINETERTWILPGNRVKNGVEHVVPLSDPALALIREAIADAGDTTFVFPSGNGPLPAHAVAKTLTRALKASPGMPLGRLGLRHLTAHDLRRTVLTQFAKLGISPIVAGAVANHVSVTRGGVTLRHYTRYSYGAEKRAALDLWADRLTGIIAGGAEIVPIAAAARR